ncbi:Fe-S cluster assembly protein SufD [Hyphomicrobium methylovorum]|uniref:Fe-S cluster assembly protein SufD n=1 Tax=Hyphomicrobium methylovorum TaxID=84 RepID=UPI0015E630CF|nr:Fe-S cluster assembly protein SufD [Hyphomicrobium methylovorum]MBA2127125.1 Fe-S cluster assembly protein SufD [Hyphomicrobium methylovorum]
MNVAVMKTKAEQALTEAFEAVADRLPGSAAVKTQRKEAIGRFGAFGLPHRRIEEWKYTDLRAHIKDVLPPSIGDQTPLTIGELIVALGPLAHVDAHRVVFVNGQHRADLDDLQDANGVTVTTLGAALSNATEPSALDLVGQSRDAITALNAAFATDGAMVEIAAGSNISKPLLAVFVRAGSEARSVSVRNVIKAGDGATATIVEAHVVLPGAAREGQSNGASSVTVGTGADIYHAKVAVDLGKCLHLSNLMVTLGEDATYRGFQFSTGLGVARNEINVIYAGEGGKLDLSGAYLARGHEHIDTTLIVDHAVPNCMSRELFKGVLDDQARGVFQGKIIVQPDAQKTDGKQMSQALMLSPDAEFDSKPELEIFADDVVCGHGTTTAQLDEDLLFYCRSRGIPEAESRALLIDSFIGEALDKVENEELRSALVGYAADWLKGANRG